MRRSFSFSFLYLLPLLALGCGGSGSAADAGVTIDANAPTDANAADAAVDSTTSDSGPGVCTGDDRMVPLIYYGTVAPTFLPLSPGQVLAIGTFGGCSGTFINQRWVLTAQHCGLSVGATFCVGTDPANPDVCFRGDRVENNPDADTTLVHVNADASSRLPELVPIQILTESMDSTWLRRTAEASGYGQNDLGGSGVRAFTAEPIVDIRGNFISIDGEGRHGVCFGDSGGPLMVLASDGTVRVAADLSGGADSCVGIDNFTRVDIQVPWIEAATGPTIVPGGSCGSLTSEGRCVSGQAAWCEGDVAQTEICAAGESCGWDDAATGYRCIAGDNPCGGLDTVGACDGSTARWCERGVPKRRDCAPCGDVCQLLPDFDGYGCVPDPCMGIDYLGHCDGDVAEWCQSGSLARRNCASEGKTCGYVNGDVGYFCQ